MVGFTINSWISDSTLSSGTFGDLLLLVFVLSIPTSILFLLLIRTPGMQRWGKPIATSSKFRNHYKPSEQEKKALTYFLDYAPQDTRYARTMTRSLGKDGHCRVNSKYGANIVFVLISKFKKKSVFDPEKKLVYPILLQETHSIDARLQAIQWIDFRRGVRKMKQLSSLIGKPNMILKALGVTPSNQQTVLPIVIQGINYSLNFLSMLIIGSAVFMSILDFSNIFSWNYIGRLVAGCIFFLIIESIRRDIVQREGVIVRSTGTLLLSMFTTSLIVNIITSTSFRLYGISSSNNYQFPEGKLNPSVFFSVAFAWSYYAAIGLTFLLILIYWRDLRRWIPFQEPKKLIYKLRDYFTRGLTISFLSVCLLFMPYLFLATAILVVAIRLRRNNSEQWR